MVNTGTGSIILVPFFTPKCLRFLLENACKQCLHSCRVFCSRVCGVGREYVSLFPVNSFILIIYTFTSGPNNLISKSCAKACESQLTFEIVCMKTITLYQIILTEIISWVYQVYDNILCLTQTAAAHKGRALTWPSNPKQIILIPPGEWNL